MLKETDYQEVVRTYPINKLQHYLAMVFAGFWASKFAERRLRGQSFDSTIYKNEYFAVYSRFYKKAFCKFSRETKEYGAKHFRLAYYSSPVLPEGRQLFFRTK